MDIELKNKWYILYVFLPLVAIGIFCLRYNQNIFNYYLPNSQWNDEVIYYKTIEGITKYRIPQGYFGYNESKAIIGTFGAWSPTIYVFDAIWGLIFGWNLYSPIIVRVFLACIGMLTYARLAKPNARNSLYIWLFIISFSLYARYIASQMIDCYMVTLLIIYIGLYSRRQEKKCKLIIKIILIILTLTRPYYVLLWLPIWDSCENKKRKIEDGLVACGSLVGYFVSSHYYTAPYFTSLIKFDLFKLILEKPFEGMLNICSILYKALQIICSSIASAFVDGNDVGLQYFVYLIFTFCFLFLSLIHKKQRKEWLLWFVVNMVFWFAIILLYDVRVGSRHLMPFIVMEGFLVLGQNRYNFSKIFFVTLVLYLCLFKLTDSYLMTYPSNDYALQSQISEIQDKLENQIVIDDENKWNNTIIWVLSDVDGIYPWQTLYAIPAGMGINICTYDYVVSRFENLGAKYIACTANGDVARLCDTNGYERIVFMSDYNACIYKRHE